MHIIVGLSGVGKSTLIDRAMDQSDHDWNVISMGSMMLRSAKAHGYIDDRDELKRLDPADNKQVHREDVSEISQEVYKHDRVILDTHASIMTPMGYQPGLPKWEVDKLDPDQIVMIDAPSEDIYDRMHGDTRDREHTSIDQIDEYRQIERRMAITASVLSDAYFATVENPDGDIDQSANRLVDTLESMYACSM